MSTKTATRSIAPWTASTTSSASEEVGLAATAAPEARVASEFAALMVEACLLLLTDNLEVLVVAEASSCRLVFRWTAPLAATLSTSSTILLTGSGSRHLHS